MLGGDGGDGGDSRGLVVAVQSHDLSRHGHGEVRLGKVEPETRGCVAGDGGVSPRGGVQVQVQVQVPQLRSETELPAA